MSIPTVEAIENVLAEITSRRMGIDLIMPSDTPGPPTVDAVVFIIDQFELPPERIAHPSMGSIAEHIEAANISALLVIATDASLRRFPRPESGAPDVGWQEFCRCQIQTAIVRRI